MQNIIHILIKVGISVTRELIYSIKTKQLRYE